MDQEEEGDLSFTSSHGNDAIGDMAHSSQPSVSAKRTRASLSSLPETHAGGDKTDALGQSVGGDEEGGDMGNWTEETPASSPQPQTPVLPVSLDRSEEGANGRAANEDEHVANEDEGRTFEEAVDESAQNAAREQDHDPRSGEAVSTDQHSLEQDSGAVAAHPSEESSQMERDTTEHNQASSPQREEMDGDAPAPEELHSNSSLAAHTADPADLEEHGVETEGDAATDAGPSVVQPPIVIHPASATLSGESEDDQRTEYFSRPTRSLADENDDQDPATQRPQTIAPVPRRPSGQQSHNRVDSLPPQRYHINTAVDSTDTGLLSPPLEENLQLELDEPFEYQPNRAHEAYEPPQMMSGERWSRVAQGLGIRTGSGSEIVHKSPGSPSFVEVSLDANGSPYGAGRWVGSRSVADIRQDHISSDAFKRGRSRAEPQIVRTPSPHAETSSAAIRRVSGERRSAEGRYRGRRSAQSSRAPSPVSPDPGSRRASVRSTPTISAGHRVGEEELQQQQRLALGVQQGFPGLSDIAMAVASEDGEVQVVATSPHTSVAPLPRVAPPISSHPVRKSSSSNSDATAKSPPPAAEAPPQATNDALSSEASSSKTPANAGAASSPALSPPASSSSPPASADSRPSLSDAADQPSKLGRRASKGPSALETVVNRTRMTHLPPKTRVEEARHLTAFEQMMRGSKLAERRREEEAIARRLRNDAKQIEATQIWEKEILPNWKVARRDARLRELWFRGAPPALRGRIWALAIGNAQMLPRDQLRQAAGAAQRALADGTFPADVLRELEEDIEQTLPSLKLYQKAVGPLWEELRELLCAFVMVRLEQAQQVQQDHDRWESQPQGNGNGRQPNGDGSVGLQRSSSGSSPTDRVYVRGTACLGAMLLSNLSASEALTALFNMLAERPFLRAIYALQPDAGSLEGYERVFDTLLADSLPKVYANMQARSVRPSAYMRDWVRTLFVPFLPFDAAARLWDALLLDESDALIFRAALAIVHILEARLYAPDGRELVSILRGNNRASLAVWYRELAHAPAHEAAVAAAALRSPLVSPTSPTGGPLSPTTPLSSLNGALHPAPPPVEADEALVPLDNIYMQYHVTEQVLFAALEEQMGWWKDSTLERLLNRELGG